MTSKCIQAKIPLSGTSIDNGTYALEVASIVLGSFRLSGYFIVIGSVFTGLLLRSNASQIIDASSNSGSFKLALLNKRFGELCDLIVVLFPLRDLPCSDKLWLFLKGGFMQVY